MIPPTKQTMIASAMNCVRMPRWHAPRAMRTPTTVSMAPIIVIRWLKLAISLDALDTLAWKSGLYA
ncbi:hypothetical protein C3E79_02945 [Corynebacterium liangguodongii]|uniref:Uncharacterized protein n=1 Tax=Corynebacterium liangguodongii TaxID=2079535 RepID=A0A2S0WCT6_9CORY|nr:hypothetical protein [Corynebacterium liangguodongii]AWB83573.1 hypothetical protein C3E79_02945 [Corynebacterium liangguodongii]PWC00337.1 hypothetical protein DF219_00005 [Corynebacterium liangguodongii]